MKNRAPRCSHGFYQRLCVVAGCAHFDGGANPLSPEREVKGAHGGASEAVRAALLSTPDMSNPEIAALCGCSRSLVGAIRRELGLRRAL